MFSSVELFIKNATKIKHKYVCLQNAHYDI